MNVDSSMCASSGKAAHWDQVDWPKCERQVRRLQARIVKATREGRWGKVKALQRLLTHSFSGKALAVKRVTENQGKRHAGSGRGQSGQLRRPNSRPSDRCNVADTDRCPCAGSISRKPMENKDRWAFPTMKDRAMQALYLLALEPVAETDRRSQLLWLPTRTLHCRRHRTVLQCAVPGDARRSGCWKATSKAASTTSATTGCSNMSSRTRWCSRNG